MQDCLFDPVQPIFMSLTAQIKFRVRTWQGVFCALMSYNKVGEQRRFRENNMLLLCSGPDCYGCVYVLWVCVCVGFVLYGCVGLYVIMWVCVWWVL